VTAARRLTAILAADVVGYSRLMGEDEAGTAKIVRERREAATPIVRSFGGRLVKTMGDGVLLEFPSVVAAVECAIAIQKMMAERNATVPEAKRILYRVGVNLGDILIDGEDILGDGVNVAARLEGVCEPGGICLSASAYDQVRGRVEAEFADLGEQSLKNIAHPVRAYALTPAAIATAKVELAEASASASQSPAPERREPPRLPKPSAPKKRAALISLAAGIAVLVILIAGGARYFISTHWVASDASNAPPPLATQRLSIVVLPFANLSGDPAQDYFADGLTEDVISALGRFPEMTVISRSAAFAYKGKSARPDEIGRELNVTYLVDGSLRKTSDRARVSVELLETARATLLWTEQYDRDIKDLLTIQDEIARQIAGALSVRLTALQLARSASKPPSSLEAYDLVLRGRDLSRRDRRAALSQARQLFERSIELDQGYAPAYAGLGGVDVMVAESGYTSDPDGALTRAEANGRKALSNDENVGAHILLGRIHIIRGEYDRAVDELRRAVELNPSDPEAQSGFADALLWSGDTGSAIEAMRKVARVQPILTDDEYVDLGMAYLIAGETRDAIATLGHAIQRYDDDGFLHALLAGAYATAGRKADAAGEAEIVKRMLPGFQSKDSATRLRDPGQRSKVIAALTAAGL
jgi:TolB-like protein/class 3 adenylate cyclase/Flp pilus assembly protein TadD